MLGINPPGPALHECTDENYDRIMDVNCRGVFNCLRAEIRQILQQSGTKGGAIVNMASMASFIGLAGMSVYCGSKHAVAGITKAAAKEYAKHDIRV